MTDLLIQLLPRRRPRDAHAMHRAVAAATSIDTGRVLWAQPVPDLLVIRSAHVPDWGVIDGATGCTLADHPTPTGPIRWALIANPSKVDSCRCSSHHDHRRGTGRRVALPEPEIPAWAARKLDGAIDIDRIECERLAPARGRGITITRYAIAGTGTVVDPHRLAEVMAAGIGPGKAFGCGLLQVGAA